MRLRRWLIDYLLRPSMVNAGDDTGSIWCVMPTRRATALIFRSLKRTNIATG